MFFTFRQNNSGGSFDIDEARGISISVIVEADSAAEANFRAQQIGLYFDGWGDCPCCGDRWYEQYSDKDGDSVPSHYGTPLVDIAPSAWGSIGWAGDQVDTFVHMKDGRVIGFHYIDGFYVYKGDPALLGNLRAITKGN